MRLGEFIKALEELPPDAEVQFDDPQAGVGSFISYRGFYDQLALEPIQGAGRVLVGDLLSDARECVGKTFEGYKGGDFTMSEDTPLWAAEYGCSGSDIIAGVEETPLGEVVIRTANINEYLF